MINVDMIVTTSAFCERCFHTAKLTSVFQRSFKSYVNVGGT